MTELGVFIMFIIEYYFLLSQEPPATYTSLTHPNIQYPRIPLKRPQPLLVICRRLVPRVLTITS